MKVTGGDLGIGEESKDTTVQAAAQPMLFTTHTCPNCQIAIRALEQAGIQYIQVYAEDQPDLAKKFGIVAAPTLVLPDGKQVAGASNILKHVRTAVNA